jgi:hypothetical protein
MATAMMSHGATSEGASVTRGPPQEWHLVSDKCPGGFRIACRLDPCREILGIEFIVRSAGEWPCSAWRFDDGIDQKAWDGDALRRIRECGAIDDSFRGKDYAARRLHHQHVLETGSDDAAVSDGISLLDVDERDIRRQGRHHENIRPRVRIDESLEAPHRGQIRAVQAGHRHKGNALNRGPQAGDHRRAGVLARFHRPGLDCSAVGRGHPERRLIADESR